MAVTFLMLVLMKDRGSLVPSLSVGGLSMLRLIDYGGSEAAGFPGQVLNGQAVPTLFSGTHVPGALSCL